MIKLQDTSCIQDALQRFTVCGLLIYSLDGVFDEQVLLLPKSNSFLLWSVFFVCPKKSHSAYKVAKICSVSSSSSSFVLAFTAGPMTQSDTA
jgi:hypothetical protein